MKKKNTIYIIPCILVIVAFFQLYNSNYNKLTPWKGGGFGMFSTNKKNIINAIGYTDNDSILIKVTSSKLNIPISDNFLKSTINFPSESKLELLSKKLLNSYLKPENHSIQKRHIDSKSFHIIDNNKFYQTFYVPTFYKNKISAEKDGAIKIDKVKILLYEINFYENDYTVKKHFVKELILSK